MLVILVDSTLVCSNEIRNVNGHSVLLVHYVDSFECVSISILNTQRVLITYAFRLQSILKLLI